MTLEAQYMTMIAMTISGAFMGAIYDMYRVILKEWKLLRIFGFIADFVFWLISFGVVFAALQWANHGDLRIYIFVILLIGYGLYRLLLRTFVVKSTMTFVRLVQWTIRTLYRLIILLIVRPTILLYRLLLTLLHALSRIGFLVEGILLWPIRIVGKILVWILSPIILLLWKIFKKPYGKIEGFLLYLSKWFQNKDHND